MEAQQNTARSSRRRLSSEAYEVLRNALFEGKIRPGDRLSEAQLAEELMISRSPLREALGRLELEGFVERMPNGRLRATPFDVTELEQLYVLRATLEGLMARLAAPRLTSEDLARMAETINEMAHHIQSGAIQKSLDAGYRFHTAIQERCLNRPLTEAVSMVRLRIVRFRSLIASVRSHEARVAEHWAIHKAFFDRRPDLAEKAMIEHVERSAATIIAAVKVIPAENKGLYAEAHKLGE